MFCDWNIGMSCHRDDLSIDKVDMLMSNNFEIKLLGRLGLGWGAGARSPGAPGAGVRSPGAGTRRVRARWCSCSTLL